MVLSSLLPVAAVTTGLGGAGLWWNKRRKKGPTLEERFQSWMTADDDFDDELKTWLGERSESEMKTLLAQLALHCAESGMELEWLFGEEAFNEALRAALRKITLAYLTSHMIAAQAAEDAQAFKAYQAFNNKPKKHAEFGNLFYTRLVDNGIASVSTANLLTNSNKKRQKHIISTIQQVAIDKPKAFHDTLKAVVHDMDPKNQKSAQVEPAAPAESLEPVESTHPASA